MPRKIGFHVYTVRIKRKYQREHEPLSSVLGQFDTYTVLGRELRRIIENHRKDEGSERLSCMKKVTTGDRVLTGIINAGHYGEAADIVNSINASVSYEKTIDDAEMIPCFFRLHIPEDRDEALLILQRDNRVSCKGAFYSLIAPIIAAQDPDLKVDITPLTNAQAFRKLVDEGAVQRLRFIKMGITSDFADSYDSGHQEVEGTMELIVKARRGYSLPFRSIISRWSRSNQSVKELYEVPALDFDSVKADVKIGRTTRTIDFGKKLTSPIIDLTSDVRFGSNGHPTYASLQSATASLAEDYLSEMYD